MAESASSQKKMSDLRLRLLSAVVLGPTVLFVTYWGGLPYSLLILVAVALFLWEWLTITGTGKTSTVAIAGYGALVAVLVAHVLGAVEYGLAAVAVAAAFAALGTGLSRSGRWAGEGILFSGLALIALLTIRTGSNGLLFAFFLLIVVWATDIFAYFVGRFVGGPKLWVRVSPKKTWSGAMGGLVFSVVLGTAIASAFGAVNLASWALLSAVLSVVSQGGDLLESAIKRRFSVKDSSRLIPGHGGIMDRIDGLVAAAIFAVILGLILGGSLSDPIAGLGLM
ncbi:phosphatidate cytidylyltransferase [Roseibium denhamense]|nr:phosphatidate cytidylyltransferase [Roseibium denhamense]